MWYARSGGSKTPLRKADADIDSLFVGIALVFVVPKIGGLAPLPPLPPHWFLLSVCIVLQLEGYQKLFIFTWQ